MAETNTSNIGFEKQIWDAACVLRGNIDASEYKSVVLGLIFLKYISDRFEAKHKELVDEGDGFEEDKDEYTAENIFFVPENARWSVIAGAAHTPEIGTVIDEAMRSIEQENKRLKDILPKNFARQELDKRRLGDVVDLFTNIQMVEHGDSKDILGRTYEYCLSKFAEQEGKLAGEFYTPSCVVRTLVEILQPYNGRVYDPCCGSGGMFVQSAKFIENHGGNINKISVFGQDSNPTTWKMAQMNLAIRGIEADLGKFSADTFFNDAYPQLKADFIMANPPFNLSGWGQDKLLDDVRWQYGTPPAGNANFAWLQHMIWHLAPGGRVGMVLANGSLSSQSGGEGEIRKNIINADLVDCIVAMPSQLFYTTQIPVSLWFLAKNKKQKGKTLLIDARKMGTISQPYWFKILPLGLLFWRVWRFSIAIYLSDDPEVHDVDDGLQWLERAARNGNADAAYRLGKEYLTGKSVQKDAAKAAEYLRHAADQNHPWSSYLLGKLYLTGSGVPKDEEAARNCFRMADAYGHPNAQYVLERRDQWHQPQLLMTVSRLLYHMSNIFPDNAPTVSAQPKLHIDRKRMQELQELRIALGHQPDDHEEEQTQTQTWGGMTMKGW